MTFNKINNEILTISSLKRTALPHKIALCLTKYNYSRKKTTPFSKCKICNVISECLVIVIRYFVSFFSKKVKTYLEQKVANFSHIKTTRKQNISSTLWVYSLPQS